MLPERSILMSLPWSSTSPVPPKYVEATRAVAAALSTLTTTCCEPQQLELLTTPGVTG